MINSIQITEKQFPGVDLMYASWIDGIEHQGLKFEQDIPNAVFSEFIDPQKHTLRTLY
jgi:hypothetical protein